MYCHYFLGTLWYTLSPSFWDIQRWEKWMLLLVSRSLRCCSFIFPVALLFRLDKFYHLSSSSLILSPLSNAFLLWLLITYASPIISIWFFFYNFYFFYKIFLVFIHFKRISNWLLKQFITYLKSLSVNSNPDVPRCCLTLWLHGP